jgi:hypothetical protein
VHMSDAPAGSSRAVRTGRSRDAVASRDALLRAGQTLFGQQGFEPVVGRERLRIAGQARLVRGPMVWRWLTTPSGWRDGVAFWAVYLAYSMSRYVSIASRATAIAHVRHIEHVERALHLGIEAQVQAFFNHGPTPQVFNYVYLCAQLFVIPGVLVLLYVRGPRRVYRGLRDTVLVSWLLALRIYAVYRRLRIYAVYRRLRPAWPAWGSSIPPAGTR